MWWRTPLSNIGSKPETRAARDNDLLDVEGDERSALLVNDPLLVMEQGRTFLSIEVLACLVQLPIGIGTVPIGLVPGRADAVGFPGPSPG